LRLYLFDLGSRAGLSCLHRGDELFVLLKANPILAKKQGILVVFSLQFRQHAEVSLPLNQQSGLFGFAVILPISDSLPDVLLI